MVAIRVEVTPDHIAAAGDDRFYWAQPVEDALGALTGQRVDIDAAGSTTAGEHWCIATIGQDAWTLVVDLPEPANAWLEARWGHDVDEKIGADPKVATRGEPFAFDLDVPTWLTDLILIAGEREPEFLTIAEAAAALDLQPQTLRSAANQLRDGVASEDALAGRLGIRRVGRDWLVPRDRLEVEVARRNRP